MANLWGVCCFSMAHFQADGASFIPKQMTWQQCGYGDVCESMVLLCASLSAILLAAMIDAFMSVGDFKECCACLISSSSILIYKNILC